MKAFLTVSNRDIEILFTSGLASFGTPCGFDKAFLCWYFEARMETEVAVSLSIGGLTFLTAETGRLRDVSLY